MSIVVVDVGDHRLGIRRDDWDAMLDRAAQVYEFGVFPGDESQATDEEIREMAARVLNAALRDGKNPA